MSRLSDISDLGAVAVARGFVGGSTPLTSVTPGTASADNGASLGHDLCRCNLDLDALCARPAIDAIMAVVTRSVIGIRSAVITLAVGHV